MNDFVHATDLNIKRLRNLLETSVNETERRTLQKLLAKEEAAQTLNRSLAISSTSGLRPTRLGMAKSRERSTPNSDS
jgi:hypothetical protein